VPQIQRDGAWVDQVILIAEPDNAKAVTRLESAEIDVYAYTIGNRDLFARVRDNPDLSYALSYGSYNEITFNNYGPVFSGTQKLNPFAVRETREAMNYLVDRDYIVQEIMGGLASARYTALSTAMPDYAKYADVARAIELKYAYNPDKAKEIFDVEMAKMGATIENGKYVFNGEPVTLIFIIRTEDERRQIGDYVSTQLESIGFTVDRQYKRSSEASPIWVRSNPADGLWHLYTGGWITTLIDRDQGDNFAFFYLAGRYPIPLWETYVNTPEYIEVAEKLEVNNFTTLEERDQLFAQALEQSLLASQRIWLCDRKAFAPYRNNIAVASDLAGSIYTGSLWPQTLRRLGEVGGAITMATTDLLTDPWNPVAGSNWAYDMFPVRGISDQSTKSDPFTGLIWPQRIERAECVAEEGLPIGTSLDWVTMSFAPSIEVPADAWTDWDATNQVFVTVGEKFTQTQTVRTKCTTYYPADLWDTVKWHDGSPISMGDFILYMILQFDRAKPESAVYDEVSVSDYETLVSHLKGWKILSTDPLVIETYDDTWYLDAEYMPTTWWPYYAYGQAAWHSLVPGLLAEARKELAFSADKADALTVEWMSMVSGPSLEILNSRLISATAETLIPYAPTMGEYVTTEEATARYANLATWYDNKGHFWLGTGPFYLEKAFPLEKTVLLKRNLEYPDDANKWLRFSEPRVAVVEVEGPESVTIGQEAAFDVLVTFKDEPYPAADVAQVKFLVLDATGALAGSGAAEGVADGQWKVTLPAELTAKLAAGSNRLEVVVVPSVVSLPSFAAMQFVTAP
jgi:peptide/nickel transport system substrate-binding protein